MLILRAHSHWGGVAFKTDLWVVVGEMRGDRPSDRLWSSIALCRGRGLLSNGYSLLVLRDDKDPALFQPV